MQKTEKQNRRYSAVLPKYFQFDLYNPGIASQVSKWSKDDYVLDFQASAYYFTNFQSRSLASLQPRTIKPFVTEDGSKLYYDCDGEIVYALYSTGAVVSIHPNNVAARTASGDYWMVGPNGNSFRVD